MSSFLQLSLILALILLAAKFAGYVSLRLGQPSVLGELLIGILLGPTLLNILHLPFVENEHLAEIVKEFGELGVLLLMFIAGLELHIEELKQNRQVSALSGVLGVAVPVLMGWGTGALFGFGRQESIFLGLTLGATSVSISAQTLMEMKVLRSRVGLSLLGAAVFDDILVILLLSLFFALTGGSGLLDVFLIFGRMVLFLVLSIAVGLFLLPGIVHWVRQQPVSQNTLTLAIIFILIYGVAAELIGSMAAITGAFLAGLMFSRTSEREKLEPRISALAYGFFVPIFFVDIGLEVNLRSLQSDLWFLLAIILVAVIGKLLGAGAGARLGGLSWRESTQVGMGMVSRGEVGLIVAAVGARAGILGEQVLSSVLGVVIATTLLTPPALRALFKQKSNPETQEKTEKEHQKS